MQDLGIGDEVAVVCEHGFVVYKLIIVLGQKSTTSAIVGLADSGSGYVAERTFNSIDLLGTPEHTRHMWPLKKAESGDFAASNCNCTLAPPAGGEQQRLMQLKGKKK